MSSSMIPGQPASQPGQPASPGRIPTTGCTTGYMYGSPQPASQAEPASQPAKPDIAAVPSRTSIGIWLIPRTTFQYRCLSFLLSRP